LVCQKLPKAVQPAQPTIQSCKKNELEKNIRYVLVLIFSETLREEGYFEYGNFKFENGNFEKQSGELKTKWGTKSKVGN